MAIERDPARVATGGLAGLLGSTFSPIPPTPTDEQRRVTAQAPTALSGQIINIPTFKPAAVTQLPSPLLIRPETVSRRYFRGPAEGVFGPGTSKLDDTLNKIGQIIREQVEQYRSTAAEEPIKPQEISPETTSATGVPAETPPQQVTTPFEEALPRQEIPVEPKTFAGVTPEELLPPPPMWKTPTPIVEPPTRPPEPVRPSEPETLPPVTKLPPTFEITEELPESRPESPLPPPPLQPELPIVTPVPTPIVPPVPPPSITQSGFQAYPYPQQYNWAEYYGGGPEIPSPTGPVPAPPAPDTNPVSPTFEVFRDLWDWDRDWGEWGRSQEPV